MLKTKGIKFLQYIIYQRTELDESSFLFWLQIKILARFSAFSKFHKPLVFLRVVFNQKKIRQKFHKSIEQDYKDVMPHLPNVASPVIVDIGSGIGGIDLKLYDHYGQADLYLVDKSHTERNIWYGFTGLGAYYNDLDISCEFLCLNGVARKDVHLVDADRFHILSVQADVVISLLSWGYHYPVSTYIRRVHEILKPTGVLILDIRRNSDGIRELEEAFGHIEIIRESEVDSLTRVKAVKLLGSQLDVDIGRILPQGPSA